MLKFFLLPIILFLQPTFIFTLISSSSFTIFLAAHLESLVAAVSTCICFPFYFQCQQFLFLCCIISLLANILFLVSVFINCYMDLLLVHKKATQLYFLSKPVKQAATY
jgi:hypothetical protein